MRDVFLSYRYDDANKELARKAEALLESHSLRAVTGDVLGGRGWTTHAFCLDELKHARSKGRPAIALLEDGVETGAFLPDEK